MGRRRRAPAAAGQERGGLVVGVLLALVAGLLVVLSRVLPEWALFVLAPLLTLPALVVSGPVAYQLVTARATDELPGGLVPPGCRGCGAAVGSCPVDRRTTSARPVCP